ncbi:MAG TPA: response regulator, partial [Candidatus Acidoferrales bacterium]|nr:response regulator [Candidatus Acidoferrales bacterium]
FWFALPLPEEAVLPEPADAPAGAAGNARADAASQRPRRIAGARVLLAEDQAVNQKLVLHVLRNAGCVVDVAVEGRRACALAARHAYDLVLMDCHMPEMDGFEASLAIREREREERATRGVDRHLPIVALTASVLPEDRERCFASGMDDFLSKPCRPEQLLAAVARWAGARDAGSEDAAREAA